MMMPARSILPILSSLLAAAVAASPAAGDELLPLLDRFDDDAVENAGEAEGFWSPRVYSANNGFIRLDDGRLWLKADDPDNRNNRRTALQSAQAHAELDFFSQPIQISAHGIDIWADQAIDARLYIGLADDADLYWSTDHALYVRVDLDGWVELFAKHDSPNDLGDVLAEFPPDDASPTGFDLSVDGQAYRISVRYDDESTREETGRHGLSRGWGPAHANIELHQLNSWHAEAWLDRFEIHPASSVQP